MKDQYLKAAFEMFDTDGSGKIDNKEVVALLNAEELGGYASKAAIAKALKEIDENGDGTVDAYIDETWTDLDGDTALTPQ